MKFRILVAGTVAAVASLALPFAAQAQGVPDGMAHGFYQGGRMAGPVGAVVGGAVGGFIGGVNGVLGITPAYADYPEGQPRLYRYRHYIRHTYHHAHHRHTTG